MRRLAIIDHVVSAGGVERFLHGLVSGMLELPEIRDWEITILLKKSNSAGRKVDWPPHLCAGNLNVKYLRDEKLSRILDRLASAKRIWKIPGTGRAIRMIPSIFKKVGNLRMRGLAGEVKAWIENYCRRNRLDLVYFSYPYLMDCPSLQNPMVVTPHDFNYKHLTTFDEQARALIDRQTPEWLHRSRSLVVSSEFVAAELYAFYPEVGNKVRIIRPGIPESRRKPSSDEISAYSQRAGLPERFILTTGWIVPHKNQKVLFDALHYLRARGCDIPLVFTGPNSDQLRAISSQGNGGYLMETLEFARSLGLEYRRDFLALGYVGDYELECLYQLAAALVVPSLYEAGSFPVLEAVNASCPVLCSKIPALVEQSRLLGENLWLFDPLDPKELAASVQEMLANKWLARFRAERAKELASTVYSWKKAAAGYLDAFKEAMDEGRGP